MLRLRGDRITRLPWRQGCFFALYLLLLCVLLGAVGGLPARAGDEVKVYINGNLLTSAVPPYLDTAGRTMIPIRAVMEYMGARVDWQEGEQKVVVQRYGNTVELWIGRRQARLNGGTLWLYTAPVLKQSTTMVPVRTVAESFGGLVEWDGASFSVRLWLPERVGFEQARVIGSYVNIRSGPGLHFGVRTVVEKGTLLEVLGGVPGWYQVRLPGGEVGWIYSELVEPVPLKPAEETAEPGRGGGALVISGLEVTTVAEGLKVWVRATQTFNYNAFSLSNPPRLVVDIPGALLEIPKDRWRVEVGKNGIRRLRLSQYTPDTVRLVFESGGYSKTH